MRLAVMRSGVGAAMAVIGLCSLSAGRSAQAAADTNDSESKRADTLEEIIITAQKRSENLQKSAVAVTAISGNTLSETGTVDAQGLTDLVPGVEVAQNNANTIFAIRGISSTTDATLGDAAVAFHLDGVFEGRPAAASGLFYDIARVEVLRGPQGTLYGRNATAGTVNVITNAPDLSGYQGDVVVETGNYAELRTEAMLNAPLTDTFALRIAAQTLRHNGYLNSGYDDADDHAARLQALWKPNEAFSVLLFGDFFHQGGVGAGYTQLPVGSDPWHTPLPLITFSGGGYPSPPGTTDDLSWSVHAELTWDLGPV